MDLDHRNQVIQLLRDPQLLKAAIDPSIFNPLSPLEECIVCWIRVIGRDNIDEAIRQICILS